MSTIKTATLATIALAAGLGLAPALHAQDAPSGTNTQKPQSGMDHGGMMGGDMASMMKMMESCNRMMQSMSSQSPQNPSAPPATPGQKG